MGAGPVCSVPCADEDVDAYLEAWDSLLDALVGLSDRRRPGLAASRR